MRRECFICGEPAEFRRLHVTPDLRRRIVPVCANDAAGSRGAVRRRTRADWRHEKAVRITLSPDIARQYDARSRRTLRAFLDSELPIATVDGDAATLNQSAGALGLGAEVYAEVRDGTTVLRRAGK